MKRLLSLVVFLAGVGGLIGQDLPSWADEDQPQDSTSNRLKIVNADILSFQRVDGVSLQKLIGNVELLQDSTTFLCDSAYYYEEDNRIEAFDNVKVIMPDSVTMVAERATYDGQTRIAEVFDKITLTDRSVTLTTDHLIYDRNEKFGYYDESGTLIDEETELTSIFGYYYPDEDMAYFREEVVLTSPDYTLYTDTLAYDTDLKIARFVTLTKIVSQNGDIETTSGNYNTEARRVNLFARSQVKDSTYILSADTLFYDDELNMGFGIGRVVVDQQDTTLQIKGNYGEFDRETDESLVTENPVAIQVFEEDTLFLFADTLRSYVEVRIDTIRYQFLPQSLGTIDSLLHDFEAQDSLERDSAALAACIMDSLGVDTFRIDSQKSRMFKGYYNVQFYMRELQGRCDSLVYFYDDSLLFLYQDPRLWSDESQIYGDTVKVWMKNGEADSMWIGEGAFLVSEEDTVGHNQIKGKEMRASFRNGELMHMTVLGNSESIYFAKEEDSTGTRYQGMNQALAQSMKLYFVENELQRIVFISQPEGSFKPMFEVMFQPNRLDGMRWEPERRPEKPDAVQIMLGLWPPVIEQKDVPTLVPLPFEGKEAFQSETSPITEEESVQPEEVQNQ